jgi:hypothetical protein
MILFQPSPFVLNRVLSRTPVLAEIADGCPRL